MTLLSIDWNPSRIFIEIGPLAIHYYSLMFLIAFLLGIFIEKKLYKNDGVPTKYVDTLFVYVAIATLLGARLGEVFFYGGLESFKGRLWQILLPIQFQPEFKIIGFRGLASHGAAIGIIIAIFLFHKKVLKKKSMLWGLDRVVIPVAIGGAFVRFGNLMNSEIVGKYTGTDYGFVFLKLGETAPRHPTQLYESVGYILVFIILWLIYWRTDKRKKEGYIFGMFMILLWTVRFIIEFFKEAQLDERESWVLNTGQWLSIPLILIGFYFVLRKGKNR